MISQEEKQKKWRRYKVMRNLFYTLSASVIISSGAMIYDSIANCPKEVKDYNVALNEFHGIKYIFGEYDNTCNEDNPWIIQDARYVVDKYDLGCCLSNEEIHFLETKKDSLEIKVNETYPVFKREFLKSFFLGMLPIIGIGLTAVPPFFYIRYRKYVDN